MPSHEQLSSVRSRLGAIPRKRLVPTPERCFMCGRDIVAGQRYVKLMMGPAHVDCRPPHPEARSAR